jgi:hypothetical protein
MVVQLTHLCGGTSTAKPNPLQRSMLTAAYSCLEINTFQRLLHTEKITKYVQYVNQSFEASYIHSSNN